MSQLSRDLTQYARNVRAEANGLSNQSYNARPNLLTVLRVLGVDLRSFMHARSPILKDSNALWNWRFRRSNEHF